MTMWNAFFVIAGAVALWFGTWRGRAGFTAEGRIKAVVRFAANVDMAVASKDIGDRISDRLRREQRAALPAIPIALALALVFVFGPLATAPPQWGALSVYILWTGATFGQAIAAVVVGFRPDPTLPRIARMTRTTLHDYADPVIVLASRAVVLVAGAVSLWSALIGRNMPIIALTALLSIATLVAAELTALALVRHPQRARDDEELRWDDAFRAEAIAGLYSAPVLLTVLPVFVGGGDLAFAYGGDAANTVFATVLMVVFAACLLGGVTRRPGRRAVRMLWGDAPEQEAAC